MELLKTALAIYLGFLTVSEISAEKWSTFTKLWPGGVIPYKVSKFVQLADQKGSLQQAMDDIQDNTCIKFTPRADEQDLILFSAGLDCDGSTGRQGGEQVVTLQLPFCLEKKRLLKQLLHVLGLPNEILRPDRDSFVTINWDNISLLNRPLFMKAAANSTDLPWDELPYDYASLLHAETTYKASNKTIPTITPTEPGAVLGQAIDLSPIDIMKLKVLYC